MAYQALILLAVAASASAQSYASSYNSIADPLQTYAPSAPLSSHEAPLAPSPLTYGEGALSGSSPYDHQLLLQQPSYDVTEAPQEPENPPSPVPPPSAPLYYSTQPQDPASLPLPQPQPNLLQYAPSAPSAPTQLTSHSSTSFSSPYASYQH